MNVGGPAYHVSLLGGGLDPDRFESLLVAGRVGPGEADATMLAERYRARLEYVDALGPQLRLDADARALAALVRVVRRFRPDIVHTHTAKAGMLGRLAAVLAGRPRPLILHTYHGHVLEGYFGRAQSAAYRVLERGLARVSDRLIGVSQATVDDLVRLGVAPRSKFRVVPLGLELDRFLAALPEAGAAFRREVGASEDDVVASVVGRLVPIKRVDRALRAVAAARQQGAPLFLAVVGDGDQRRALEQLAVELGLGPAVRFLGYRQDLDAIAAGTDMALLSSDNEGTPVALIEAAAAGVPAVATAVGGVAEVVTPDTGIVVDPRREEELTAALTRVGSDGPLRLEMGARARDWVRERYAAERLIADIEFLYGELLDARPPAAAR